jgi:hypothetical protein
MKAPPIIICRVAVIMLIAATILRSFASVTRVEAVTMTATILPPIRELILQIVQTVLLSTKLFEEVF